MKLLKLISGIIFSILFVYTGLGAGFTSMVTWLKFANPEVLPVNNIFKYLVPYGYLINVKLLPWVVIGIFLFITILFIITTWKWDTRLTNLPIKLLTWSTVLYLIISIGWSFIASIRLTGGISIDGTHLNRFESSLVGVILGLYILIRLFGSKLSLIINRRIQVADNARELRIPGKSSIVITNLLKIIDFIFPELLIIIFIMCITGWVSLFGSYPLGIALTIGIIFIGNTWTDFNSKREAKRFNESLKVISKTRI